MKYWLYGGPEPPRRVSADVVRLAGHMVAGRVQGYVVAMLRSDDIIECKMGGEVQRWLPAALRHLAGQVEDAPRIDAEVRSYLAERGVEAPPPVGDEDLTERQKDWLAEELRSVLRTIGRA